MTRVLCFTGMDDSRPGAGPSHVSNQSSSSTGAFWGCWFTLAALQELAEDCKTAKNMVLLNGGRVFAWNTHQLTTNKPPDSLFAVCPMGLPPSRLECLRKQDDFRSGAAHCSPCSVLAH